MWTVVWWRTKFAYIDLGWWNIKHTHMYIYIYILIICKCACLIVKRNWPRPVSKKCCQKAKQKWICKAQQLKSTWKVHPLNWKPMPKFPPTAGWSCKHFSLLVLDSWHCGFWTLAGLLILANCSYLSHTVNATYCNHILGYPGMVLLIPCWSMVQVSLEATIRTLGKLSVPYGCWTNML